MSRQTCGPNNPAPGTSVVASINEANSGQLTSPRAYNLANGRMLTSPSPTRTHILQNRSGRAQSPLRIDIQEAHAVSGRLSPVAKLSAILFPAESGGDGHSPMQSPQSTPRSQHSRPSSARSHHSRPSSAMDTEPGGGSGSGSSMLSPRCFQPVSSSSSSIPTSKGNGAMGTCLIGAGGNLPRPEPVPDHSVGVAGSTGCWSPQELRSAFEQLTERQWDKMVQEQGWKINSFGQREEKNFASFVRMVLPIGEPPPVEKRKHKRKPRGPTVSDYHHNVSV